MLFRSVPRQLKNIFLAGGLMGRNDVSLIIKSQSTCHWRFCHVLDVVAVMTKQLKVVVAECNAHVVDVLVAQIYLVMHNLSTCTTSLTQSMHRDNIRCPTFLPGCGLIESFSKLTHAITYGTYVCILMADASIPVMASICVLVSAYTSA